MGNDRGVEADGIAAAYWASVIQLRENSEVSDSVATERAEAETQPAVAAEQARQAERAGSTEGDETKKQAKAVIRPRLRPRL
ncbi:MAG: hypothetical protein ACREFN_16730 [Acetobacteraceae bacterium]